MKTDLDLRKKTKREIARLGTEAVVSVDDSEPVILREVASEAFNGARRTTFGELADTAVFLGHGLSGRSGSKFENRPIFS